MTIGELQKYLRVSRITLIRWEKKGIVKPKRSTQGNHDRIYTPEIIKGLLRRFEIK